VVVVTLLESARELSQAVGLILFLFTVMGIVGAQVGSAHAMWPLAMWPHPSGCICSFAPSCPRDERTPTFFLCRCAVVWHCTPPPHTHIFVLSFLYVLSLSRNVSRPQLFGGVLHRQCVPVAASAPRLNETLYCSSPWAVGGTCGPGYLCSPTGCGAMLRRPVPPPLCGLVAALRRRGGDLALAVAAVALEPPLPSLHLLRLCVPAFFPPRPWRMFFFQAKPRRGHGEL
jgi:hypothetical protein